MSHAPAVPSVSTTAGPVPTAPTGTLTFADVSRKAFWDIQPGERDEYRAQHYAGLKAPIIAWLQQHPAAAVVNLHEGTRYLSIAAPETVWQTIRQLHKDGQAPFQMPGLSLHFPAINI